MENIERINITRDELIEKVSKTFIDLRKESKLRQEDMANILGISKNTIVNVENSGKHYNWSVVMCIVLLFSSTSAIKNILGEGIAIETIMQCAFLENNKEDNSNKMLYEHSLTNTISTTVKLASSLIPLALGGGVLIKNFIDILNDKK
ncbi:helix-turn-helix transcriptional regulator [Clostridium sp. CS001]|uniref:helix-turn-helix domain-containing protein n=1 Tax=Clostridium sp. CS001 TaxID=2880648 RepID=UPI001CF4DA5D|nr:helix-turn-helix transcriptional regulator [Clostridium sp. CS001]MCB2290831.1 helix-turn-helix transcriptional regulator [Clostridium sp. CS001]